MLRELFRQAKVDVNLADVYSRIENMYRNSDLRSARSHLTLPQTEVFQKELDTLVEFGLRKELTLRPDKNEKNEIDAAFFDDPCDYSGCTVLYLSCHIPF